MQYVKNRRKGVCTTTCFRPPNLYLHTDRNSGVLRSLGESPEIVASAFSQSLHFLKALEQFLAPFSLDPNVFNLEKCRNDRSLKSSNAKVVCVQIKA